VLATQSPTRNLEGMIDVLGVDKIPYMTQKNDTIVEPHCSYGLPLPHRRMICRLNTEALHPECASLIWVNMLLTTRRQEESSGRRVDWRPGVDILAFPRGFGLPRHSPNRFSTSSDIRSLSNEEAALDHTSAGRRSHIRRASGADFAGWSNLCQAFEGHNQGVRHSNKA
jgi:hypothetical protein